jgi:hypothetical protein
MRFLVLFLLPALLLPSCGKDANGSTATTVEGSWELTRAYRNNTETGILQGLTFDFAPDGVLYTNMMGNEAPGTYVWSDNEIVTEGVKVSMTYTIKEMTDSTLLLRSSYRGFQFDFELVRGEGE